MWRQDHIPATGELAVKLLIDRGYLEAQIQASA
jgi:hypothetical protein